MDRVLSGRYSSVHTRLGFDTEIFTPRSPEYVEQKEDIINNLRDLYGENNEKQKRKKLMDKLYSLWKEEDLKSCHKPIYNVRLDGEESSKKRRVFSKVDENNQYGFAMTNPLPIGIFKKQSDPNMETLENSLKNFDPNAKIGEVFVVDIQFDAYDDPRKRTYNEIYPCIFQPKSKALPNRRSVYQLLSNMRSGKRGNILNFKTTEKTHATLDPKKRFPMFIDHIHFLTERAGGKVTKVHAHYSFEQEPFKKEYILGNQRARQEAVARGNGVQANFWKLLNNFNFGFDFRDNSQNKNLHLSYDEDAEIEFLTKYEGNKSTNHFLSLEARIRNIEEKYKDVENLPFDEQLFAETLKKEEIKKVTEEFNKKKDSKGKGNKVLNYVNRLEEAYADKSYTFVQYLEKDGVNSVFSVASKRQNNVRVSTIYIAAKLLINAKISLASFLYNCVDTFCFPNEKPQATYAHHKIIKVLPYLLMTDTDSGSLEFIITAEDSCDCGEREMRDSLLKISLDNDIHKRLDLSNEFFEQFDKRNVTVRKQVGLYEFENIENGIVCSLCVNPKEYLEVYGVLFNINKKHKGVKRGMLAEARESTNRFSKKQKQTRFENKKGNMIMVTVEKAKFGQLNDKRYVLPDGISSLPYGHKDLE